MLKRFFLEHTIIIILCISYFKMAPKQAKVMVPPINELFKTLQGQKRVSVWLREKPGRLLGKLRGFDEFMNIVLEETSEIDEEGQSRNIGTIMLKGDTVALISVVNDQA